VSVSCYRAVIPSASATSSVITCPRDEGESKVSVWATERETRNRKLVTGGVDGATVTRTSPSRLRQWLERRLTVDTRALAAVRVVLGTILLVDLVRRARHLATFYTDSGVLPRSLWRTAFGSYQYLSLHGLLGSVASQSLLFVLGGVAAVAVLVGYRTRIALALSLLLLVSLQARNPLVLNGGDTLLRRLLFLGLFLPLGERLAVDASDSEPRADVADLATTLLLAQTVVVYVSNAVLKLEGQTWPAGNAVRRVFDLDQFTVLAGDLLATMPPVLVAVDYAWLGLLVASPLLVVLTGRKRTLLVLAFLGAHVGMALTLRIGLFPLVSIAGLLPFLPATFWNRVWPATTPSLGGVGDRLPRGPEPPSLGRLRRPLLAVLLVLLLVSNAATLGVVSVDDSLVPEQSWDMFAPEPPGVDGWFVAPATTESGRQVDALAGRALRWDRPPDLAETYPSARWRKYLMGLRGDSEALRAALAASLCRRWNGRHDDGVDEVRIVFVAEPTRLGEPDPRQREPLGRYDCPDEGQQSSARGSSGQS